ncbi:hypothetical protein CM15mP35_10360 [bacterium]|nr:MAG: hypothetical protein CM15mP35_10360 [bacterium]
MILDLWTLINPILRLIIYGTALISIGTVLFSFHFKNILTIIFIIIVTKF